MSDLPRLLAEQRAAAAALPDPGARLGLFDLVAEEVILRTTLPATCGECAFCADKLRNVAKCTFYSTQPYPLVVHSAWPPVECPIRRFAR